VTSILENEALNPIGDFLLHIFSNNFIDPYKVSVVWWEHPSISNATSCEEFSEYRKRLAEYLKQDIVLGTIKVINHEIFHLILSDIIPIEYNMDYDRIAFMLEGWRKETKLIGHKIVKTIPEEFNIIDV